MSSPPHSSEQDPKPPMIEVQHSRTPDTDLAPLLPRLSEWPPIDYPISNLHRSFTDTGLSSYDLGSLPHDLDTQPRTLYPDFGSSINMSTISIPRSAATTNISNQSRKDGDMPTPLGFGRSTQSSPRSQQSLPQSDFYQSYQRQSFTASPHIGHGVGDITNLNAAEGADSTSPSELKRRRTESDPVESPFKRIRADSAPERPQNQIPLKDEDKLLLSLKDEQGLPWKDIAVRFVTDLGKTYQVPALQMRYKRLKERLRVWTDTDISALEQAYEYWENKKWEIISEKMLDFGSFEKWPARYCAARWQEMNPEEDPLRHDYLSVTPNLPSQRASVEPQSRMHAHTFPQAHYPTVSYPSVSYPSVSYPPVTFSPSFPWP